MRTVEAGMLGYFMFEEERRLRRVPAIVWDTKKANVNVSIHMNGN